jgi:hypothetical protein
MFSFEYFAWLRLLNDNPPAMVAWAAFGVPLAMFASALPGYILRKMGLSIPSSFMTVFYTSGTITWLTGFIVMMILLFSGIAAIRMLIIWCLMYLFYFMFCLFYHRPLKKWMDSITENKKTVDKETEQA